MTGDDGVLFYADGDVFALSLIHISAVVLYGKVDAILLTGGMAHSEYITCLLYTSLPISQYLIR